jgi:hypothetical protein
LLVIAASTVPSASHDATAAKIEIGRRRLRRAVT